MCFTEGTKPGFSGEFLEAEITGPDRLGFGHNHPTSCEDIFAKLRHRLPHSILRSLGILVLKQMTMLDSVVRK